MTSDDKQAEGNEPIRRGGRGNFAANRERAREAGRKGGRMSGGNFAGNRERAAEAGRKGGQASHRSRQQQQQH